MSRPTITTLLFTLFVCVLPAALSAGETCGGLAATIVGTDGNDVLRGTPGDDVIVGRAGNDTIFGEGGNDVICGGPGNDTLFGGPGNDMLFGDEDNDALHGEDGDDILDGGPGQNNTLHGGEGCDVCSNGKPHQCESLCKGRPPVANAGPDQTVTVGTTVTLDGSGSSDADGDPLTFLWSFERVPQGSSPAFSDPTAVRPTFAVYTAGEYAIRLIVNDGKNDSAPDFVIVSTVNSPPVANAGPDQTAFVTNTVMLNGSASSDVDGDPLTFAWSLTSVPAGSGAALSSATAVMPAFTIDLPGTYVATLVVNDRTVDSAPDTVMITTENSPPVANAGDDQTVFVGTTVALDGTRSSDVDRDALTFRWALTAVPTGSAAVLSDITSRAPTFLVDRPGTYVAQLIVNDGSVNSAPDMVTISTKNSAPVANAGPDQEAFLHQTVRLDASGSRDADGDPLTYRWSFTAVPAGSTALLSDATAQSPAFLADVHGTYVVQLIVNDGTVDSAPDTVTITTKNSPPVADAGPDQTAFVEQTVTLNGRASSDVDGDPLTFRWSLAAPAGSIAALSDPTASTPAFVIDLPGTYIATLIVNDGKVDSTADSVLITTRNSPPIANAGPDQTVLRRQTVALDGTASRDADRDPITFRWTFESLPAGSAALLSDAASATPTFVADVHGTYVLRLVVNDGTADSAPDFVTIATLNRAPVANAGPAQSANALDTVHLDGSASSDPDADPLTFHWSLITGPTGSAAALSSVTAIAPTFVADLAGTYVVRLVVNDGLTDSAPSDVTITVAPPPIRLTLLGTPFLGVGRTAEIQVMLPFAAPVGGVAVTVTSDATSLLAINEPATVFIAQGATTGIATATGVAPGGAIVRANAPGYREGTVALTVTNKVVQLPDGFSVPLGQQANLTVSIGPDPAPAGGVVIRLTTSDENVIAVSASVTILPGQTSAMAIVTGVRPGTAIVTATNPDYATDSAAVSTTAQLNIVETSTSFHAGFPQQFTIQLQSGGIAARAPDPGLNVSITSANPACATADSVFIPTGITSTTTAVTYGGSATLPCTTTLTASAPNVTPDTITVVVNAPPTITFGGFPTTVGSGLQSSGIRRAVLEAANHGGVTVHVESSNPAVAVVSANPTTVGTAAVDVFVPDGQTLAVFVVHGLEAMTGTVTITASAPRFTTGSTTATIVQPAVRLNGLATTLDTLAPNDPFNVQIGPTNATGSDLLDIQTIRPGGTPVTVTVTSSAPAIGELVTATQSGATVPVQIGVGQSTAVLTFRQLSAGTTTVSASSPGYRAVTAASVNVTVTTPTITFGGFPTTVGSGMISTGTRRAILGATNHGGATVRITSSNPAVALVSANTTTPGTAFVDIPVANGQSLAVFVVHGVEGAIGTVTITATEPRFQTGNTTVTIAQPAVRLNGLTTTLDTLDPNDGFLVQIGPANATGTDLLEVQTIGPGGTPVTVTVASSAPAIGEIVTPAQSGGTVSVQIGVGQSTAALTFRQLAAGTTTVSASAPAYRPIGTGSVNVTVTTPTITFGGFPTTVGAGMISTGTRRAILGATNHGGATVHIQSSNPAAALVSADTTTPGSAFVDIFVPNGQSLAVFVVHGVEGATGTVTITATEPRFQTGNTTVTIAQPAARLTGLVASTQVFAVNDAFNVQIGPTNATGTDLADVQTIRPGGTPVTVTITSGTPTVGELILGATTGGAVSAQLGVGQSTTPAILFHPIMAGVTTVSVSAPGFRTVGTSTVTVTVSTPTFTFGGFPVTVGAGLHSTGVRRADLTASQHGGVRVRIESSNPALALVSINATTPGTTFIEVDLANGQGQVVFVIHGMENVAGNAVITASAPGYIDNNSTVSVQPAALRLSGLLTTQTAGGADDPFLVQIGVINSTGSNLAEVQNVRPGSPGVSVTVTSSNAAVGALVTSSGNSGSATLLIGATQSQVGGISLRPLTRGSTQVTASAPNGVVTTTAGQATVTVN